MQKDITEKLDVENFAENERYYEKVELETTRDTRRKGAGLDTLANIIRGIKQMFFSNGFVIVNRSRTPIDNRKKVETGIVYVKNLFEMYFKDPSDDGLQTITIGRNNGELDDIAHTNLVQLYANHNTTIDSAEGRLNGLVRMQVGRDGNVVASNRSGVWVYDAGTLDSRFTAPATIVTTPIEGVVVHLVGQGADGGVIISHIDNLGDEASSAPCIVIDKDGVKMRNLPTVNPGISGTIWRNGSVLNIVP